MITAMARSGQASPQTVSSTPHRIAARSGPSARAGPRLITRMRMPMAATVKPWSSFTNTSGSAHTAAARSLPRDSAEREQATSGTANAISWKSKSIICWRPQENPYAAPISRAAHRDDRDRGQQGLDHQQGGRAGEEQEQGGDQADDRLEVISEQVEAGPVDGDHRGPQMGQLPDVLGEDAQVPGARVEPEVPGQ